MKKKEITIDELAIMVKRGFDHAEERSGIIEKELKDGIKELKSNFEELQGDVKGLKGDVKELKSDVKELKAGQEETNLRLDHVVGRMEVRSLEYRVERLEKKCGIDVAAISSRT